MIKRLSSYIRSLSGGLLFSRQCSRLHTWWLRRCHWIASVLSTCRLQLTLIKASNCKVIIAVAMFGDFIHSIISKPNPYSLKLCWSCHPIEKNLQDVDTSINNIATSMLTGRYEYLSFINRVINKTFTFVHQYLLNIQSHILFTLFIYIHTTMYTRVVHGCGIHKGSRITVKQQKTHNNILYCLWLELFLWNRRRRPHENQTNRIWNNMLLIPIVLSMSHVVYAHRENCN